MSRFVEGHRYDALETGLESIVVLKRTPMYIYVRNESGVEWRMKIRLCEGHKGEMIEYVMDASYGRKWMQTTAYMSTLEVREQAVDI